MIPKLISILECQRYPRCFIRTSSVPKFQSISLYSQQFQHLRQCTKWPKNDIQHWYPRCFIRTSSVPKFQSISLYSQQFQHLRQCTEWPKNDIQHCKIKSIENYILLSGTLSPNPNISHITLRLVILSYSSFWELSYISSRILESATYTVSHFELQAVLKNSDPKIDHITDGRRHGNCRFFF